MKDLVLAAVADPIHVQLGMDPLPFELLQIDADNISRLYVRGYINENVTRSARKKLVKKVQEAVNSINWGGE